MIDIMSWLQFVQLQHIRQLPLHEQVKKYNYYLMEQQILQIQTMAQQAVGGRRKIPDTGLTWNFVIATDSESPVYYFDVITKIDKPVTITAAWDGTDTISAGSYTKTIPPATTDVVSIELGVSATAVPIQITFSDPTAIDSLLFSAAYVIKKAPTNISGLIGTQLIDFQFQALSDPASLDLTQFNGNIFNWEDDTSIVSANLTNVNVTDALRFSGCASLTSLTLAGFVFNENANIKFNGCALDESTVNQLLILADASGVAYAEIDISNEGGFGNAPPTGDGETARLNLVGKGWNILYNPVI